MSGGRWVVKKQVRGITFYMGVGGAGWSRQKYAERHTEAKARRLAKRHGGVVRRLVSRAEAVERAAVKERARIVAFIRGITLDGYKEADAEQTRSMIAHCVEMLPLFDFAARDPEVQKMRGGQ